MNVTIFVNFFWTIVNLLPIHPLDGGQLLRIILEAVMGIRGIKVAFFLSMLFSSAVTILAFTYQEIFLGSLFFILTFESYRSWKSALSITDQDHNQEVRQLFQEAEREMRQGSFDQAYQKLQKVRDFSKAGVIYMSATEYMAHILNELGKFNDAYSLLLPFSTKLNPDAMRLLHRLAYKLGHWEEAIALGNRSHQYYPTYETALINAYCHSILGQEKPAIGWLKTAIDEGLPNVTQILKKREFDHIRDNPQFQNLLDLQQKGDLLYLFLWKLINYSGINEFHLVNLLEGMYKLLMSWIWNYFLHQVALLALVCAQICAFSEGYSEQIWKFEDDKGNFPKQNVRNILVERNQFPVIRDNPNNLDQEDGWDIDWQSEDVDLLPFEVSEDYHSQQFLPNEADAEPASKKEIPPNNNRLIYSFKEAEEHVLPIDKALSIHSSNNSSFSDANDEEWNDIFQERPQSEISTATQGPSKIIDNPAPTAPTLDDMAYELKFIGEESECKDDSLEMPCSLGKKTITTDPYSLTEQVKYKSNRQALSAKKAPFQKNPSTQQTGIFGPFGKSPKSAALEEKNDPSPPQSAKSPRQKVEPRPNRIIAQLEEEPIPISPGAGQRTTPPKTILIDYNNISIIEYIRFVSRITGKNFVFDEADLQFNVTIISEEPTTLENVMTALIQELRIHGLQLIEEGNNLIIHRNQDIQTLSKVSVEDVIGSGQKDSELVTQVFKFNTLDPEKAANIIRPLLSKQALVEPSEETRHLIVTDLVTNVKQIALLFKSIDSPNSGLVIGQYVVRNSFMDTLIALAKQIMQPIAKDQSLTFVPHPAARSVFIVSTPFLVERTISVLQHIDSFQGTTRIYELDDLKFDQLAPSAPPAAETKTGGVPAEAIAPQPGLPEGKWETGKQGDWIFRPSVPSETIPQGQWIIDQQKRWYFQQEEEKLRRPAGPGTRDILPEILRAGETPRGQWVLQPEGAWVFQLAPGELLQPERLRRQVKLEKDLPVGHIDRTRFYIHKLQYRRGGDIVNALQQIGSSLQSEGAANKDLAFAIQNTQWLETSNSLVITGTESSILKVKELIDELDIPLRQVFIEMLILQTTVDDSLEYGVDFGTRSGGGNTATSQAFLGGASSLVGALDTAGVGLIPTAASMARVPGFNMGIIGQRITHNGTQFASLGALVRTLHARSHVNIVMNPKIITEDNKPAEIFVGINTPFQTQSIANNEGSIITTNVEFRDVGTTLKVTPLIGAGDIITLEIHEEVSSIAPNSVDGGGIAPTTTTPTTTINRTTTFVHVPDKHFVIISGMLNDSKERRRNQLPCLGGIPILGAAVSDKINRDSKLNLMIFIRPQIIDTEEQFRTLTRRQQDNWKQKNRLRTDWQYEVDQALDLLNIRPVCSPCEDDCTD